MVVVRSETASTVPVTGPTSITSPTPNWSSINMNRPDMKSFTMVWEPKPMATPAMLAPASRGPMLMSNTPSIMSTAALQTTAVMTLDRTELRVWARAAERLFSSFSVRSFTGPWLRIFARRSLVVALVIRLAITRTARRATRAMMKAPKAISTTFKGRSTTHSVAAARKPLSVWSNTQVQMRDGSAPQASASRPASSVPMSWASCAAVLIANLLGLGGGVPPRDVPVERAEPTPYEGAGGGAPGAAGDQGDAAGGTCASHPVRRWVRGCPPRSGRER